MIGKKFFLTKWFFGDLPTSVTRENTKMFLGDCAGKIKVSQAQKKVLIKKPKIAEKTAT